MRYAKTVGCRPECFLEGLEHEYYVSYLMKNTRKDLGTYSSYQEAYDKAINFAKALAARTDYSRDEKNSIIRSICVIDSVGDDDVTTTDLKHKLLQLEVK